MKRRASGCDGKVKHASRELAQAVADRIGARHHHKSVTVYACEHCGCYHTSSWAPERQARYETVTAGRIERERPIWERVYKPMAGYQDGTWSIVRVNDDGRCESVHGNLSAVAATVLAGAARDEQSDEDVGNGWNVVAMGAADLRRALAKAAA